MKRYRPIIVYIVTSMDTYAGPEENVGGYAGDSLTIHANRGNKKTGEAETISEGIRQQKPGKEIRKRKDQRQKGRKQKRNTRYM